MKNLALILLSVLAVSAITAHAQDSFLIAGYQQSVAEKQSARFRTLSATINDHYARTKAVVEECLRLTSVTGVADDLKQADVDAAFAAIHDDLQRLLFVQLQLVYNANPSDPWLCKQPIYPWFKGLILPSAVEIADAPVQPPTASSPAPAP